MLVSLINATEFLNAWEKICMKVFEPLLCHIQQCCNTAIFYFLFFFFSDLDLSYETFSSSGTTFTIKSVKVRGKVLNYQQSKVRTNDLYTTNTYICQSHGRLLKINKLLLIVQYYIVLSRGLTTTWKLIVKKLLADLVIYFYVLCFYFQSYDLEVTLPGLKEHTKSIKISLLPGNPSFIYDFRTVCVLVSHVHYVLSEILIVKCLNHTIITVAYRRFMFPISSWTSGLILMRLCKQQRRRDSKISFGWASSSYETLYETTGFILGT